MHSSANRLLASLIILFQNDTNGGSVLLKSLDQYRASIYLLEMIKPVLSFAHIATP